MNITRFWRQEKSTPVLLAKLVVIFSVLYVATWSLAMLAMGENPIQAYLELITAAWSRLTQP